MSLDYLVALYPFLLIFMTYVLITAYGKRYRLVVWMSRGVYTLASQHLTWNIHTSLIKIFATFILFSYVCKILGVSVQILSFTATQDVAGNHLPFALLAIAISSVFVVLPFLLLAVYTLVAASTSVPTIVDCALKPSMSSWMPSKAVAGQRLLT